MPSVQEIWMAETKKDALAAFDAFIEIWGVKYDKAVECLIKDRDALLAFYDFPAEHCKHLRTTNPIESSLTHCALSTQKSFRITTIHKAYSCIKWIETINNHFTFGGVVSFDIAPRNEITDITIQQIMGKSLCFSISWTILL